VRLLDFYITQILTSTTVIIECISWLIKVTDFVLHLLFLGRVYPRNPTVWKHNKKRGKDGSLYA